MKHSKRLWELAKENPNNVLELTLSATSDIGAMGRNHVLITDHGDNWIEGKLLEFHQDPDIKEESDYKSGGSYWEIGRKYVFSTDQIAAANPDNMLSDAEDIRGS